MSLADALVVECVLCGLVALIVWAVDRRRGRPVEARSDRAGSDFFGHG